jgi:3-oxoacyl-[acyl-carrier-protein] synthase-3
LAPGDWNGILAAMNIGLEAIEYALPATRCNLTELEAAGALETSARQLREFGFEYAFTSQEDAFSLASKATDALLQKHQIDPEKIDALFYAGAIASSHSVNPSEEFLSAFNYPACKLQYDFGLLNATVTGISQTGCMGMMTAVKCAADFLAASDAQNALCISADVFPPRAKREVIYNLISDGGCALLVRKNGSRNFLRGHRQKTKGYYWDCAARRNEIIAAYFPTACNIVRETLAEARTDLDDIACVIPHNVSRRSWEILLDLLGIPRERLFDENISSIAHIIAADNFINLKDATDRGKIRRGDKLLLFNFGFGANWGCMLLEH